MDSLKSESIQYTSFSPSHNIRGEDEGEAFINPTNQASAATLVAAEDKKEEENPDRCADLISAAATGHI
jgi:hypothetical protein